MFDMTDIHHVFVDFKTGHGSFHAFFAQHLRFAQTVAETDGFFFLIHKRIRTIICYLQGYESDGVRSQINDGYFFHNIPLFIFNQTDEGQYQLVAKYILYQKKSGAGNFL